MREERRRMEQPANRRAAEEAAARAREEAQKIARELERDGSQPTSGTSREKGHGDSIFGPDGSIDYTTAPRVKAPEGMKAVVSIKNNCWDVQLVTKE